MPKPHTEHVPPKVAVVEVDKIAVVSQAVTSCAERGGRLASVDGVVMCVPVVMAKAEPPPPTPAPPPPQPVVTQLAQVAQRDDFYDRIVVPQQVPAPVEPPRQEAKPSGSSWMPWVIGGVVAAAAISLIGHKGGASSAIATGGGPANAVAAGPVNPAP